MVSYLNLRHLRKKGGALPPEFTGVADEGVLKKIVAYETDTTRFAMVSSIFGNIATLVFIFVLLGPYDSWVASLGLPFLLSGWLFFMLLSCVSQLLSVPFGLYRTFRIENAYGFNTTTPGLWISDFIKSLLVSATLMSAVIFGGLSLVLWSPDRWWLLVWGFLLVLGIFLMYLSPYVIEPLFNKFTPVEDETLREKIVALAAKAGIRASRVLKVDASRRSRHSNAYFTGIGRTKRIVLYDTLLAGMTQGEILAILAHEIGHWKKRHLLKSLLLIEAVSLASLYVSYHLIRSDLFPALFGVEQFTFFAKVILLAFLAGIVALPLRPLMNSLSRRHEREADRFSCELTNDVEHMAGALVKLSKDNLSNLFPHPLFVVMHYSHPPVLERIRAMRGANP